MILVIRGMNHADFRDNGILNNGPIFRQVVNGVNEEGENSTISFGFYLPPAGFVLGLFLVH
jgi:hypothetical protein